MLGKLKNPYGPLCVHNAEITGFTPLTPRANARHSRLWELKLCGKFTTAQELMLITTGSSEGDPLSLIGKKVAVITNLYTGLIFRLTELFVIGPQEVEAEAQNYLQNHRDNQFFQFSEIVKELFKMGANYRKMLPQERRIIVYNPKNLAMIPYVEPKTPSQFIFEIAATPRDRIARVFRYAAKFLDKIYTTSNDYLLLLSWNRRGDLQAGSGKTILSEYLNQVKNRIAIDEVYVVLNPRDELNYAMGQPRNIVNYNGRISMQPRIFEYILRD